MTKEELEQKVESAKALVDSELESYKMKFSNVITKWMSGLGTFTINSEYNDTIKVYFKLDDTEYDYDFEFTIRNNYEVEGTEYKHTKYLDINYHSYGEIKSPAVRKYFMIFSKILENYTEIEKEILSIDRTELKKLSDALREAHKELDDFKKNEENIRREAIKKEVEEKLIVGVKIITGSRRRWNEKNEPYFQDIVKTVEKVMNKNILLKEEFYRIKKEDVISNFINGIWKWAE